jgi:glycosyltransferase involved in cell wall biosynthesis
MQPVANGAMISVVICAYNPDQLRLSRVLNALERQTLGKDCFEVLIIDNASTKPINVDMGTLEGSIVQEPKPGLTNARLRGVCEAKAELIIFVDDDNVLERNYLQVAIQLFAENAQLGALGGRVLPAWEQPAAVPPWIADVEDLLALRDLGPKPLNASSTKPPTYPACAPVGAGMIVRREAIFGWRQAVEAGAFALDRSGSSLTSGGDNDMVLHVLRSGFDVAYDPQLSLQHIIPNDRFEFDYLCRLAHAIMKSWVVVLSLHNIRPWTPIMSATAPLRKAKAYLTHKAWLSPTNYIQWKRSCGQIDGRAMLKQFA